MTDIIRTITRLPTPRPAREGSPFTLLQTYKGSLKKKEVQEPRVEGVPPLPGSKPKPRDNQT